MLENLQSAIKTRLWVVVLLVHVGLAIGIFALARESYANGWDLTSSLFLAAICGLYGGFLLAVLFIVLPLLPWLRRAQRVEHWTERLIRELPQILVVVKAVISVWNEARPQRQQQQPPSNPPSL